MTFEEWLQIWQDSGHLHERGPRKGQYVMCRYGDKGAYKRGNVRVASVEENIAEWAVTRRSLTKAQWSARLPRTKARRARTEARWVAWASRLVQVNAQLEVLQASCAGWDRRIRARRRMVQLRTFSPPVIFAKNIIAR
jgi:hypothetical protein